MPSPTRRPNLGPPTAPMDDSRRGCLSAGGCGMAVAVALVLAALAGAVWFIIVLLRPWLETLPLW